MQAVAHCGLTEFQGVLDAQVPWMQGFDGHWCDMTEISVCADSEQRWLQSCLGPNESLENKKILLLMREGGRWDGVSSAPVPGVGWFKIAIKDTLGSEPKILLRTFHNIEVWKETKGKENSVPTQLFGWWFHGGPKSKKPSTVGADKKFWLRLAYILG